jgi:hypothetical protein
MLYDRTKFFNALRNTLPKNKSLSQSQVDGFNLLLAEGERRNIPLEWIAYVLATAWHETATLMVPVRETLAASDAQAIAILNRANPNSKNNYWSSGFFGRGYVQLTWAANYKQMGTWLGVDLYDNPSLALQPDIACKIIYEGMIRGMFTSRKLSDYLDSSLESDAVEIQEYTKARAIVNGSDRAAMIAGYALTIQKALVAAQAVQVTKPMKLVALNDEPPMPEPIPLPPAPQNQPGALAMSSTVWASLGMFMTTVVGALAGLQPPVAILLILLSFGFLFWVIYQRMQGNNAIDRII